MTPIAPEGYGPLPEGGRFGRCRCAKLWQAMDGSFWCCRTGVTRPPPPPRPKTRAMRLVIIESPYGNANPCEIGANVEYARAAVRDAVLKGESPIASHLLFTQPGILRDEVAAERALGIAAGLAWRRTADASLFYTDRGWSRGMLAALESAADAGAIFELRSLQGKIRFPEGGDYRDLVERGAQTS